MAKYNRLPETREARQIPPIVNPDFFAIAAWCSGEAIHDAIGAAILVDTSHGRVRATPSDWILQDPETGEFYPCKDAVFVRLYVLAAETPESPTYIGYDLGSQDFSAELVLQGQAAASALEQFEATDAADAAALNVLAVIVDEANAPVLTVTADPADSDVKQYHVEPLAPVDPIGAATEAQASAALDAAPRKTTRRKAQGTPE